MFVAVDGCYVVCLCNCGYNSHLLRRSSTTVIHCDSATVIHCGGHCDGTTAIYNGHPLWRSFIAMVIHCDSHLLQQSSATTVIYCDDATYCNSHPLQRYNGHLLRQSSTATVIHCDGIILHPAAQVTAGAIVAATPGGKVGWMIDKQRRK